MEQPAPGPTDPPARPRTRRRHLRVLGIVIVVALGWLAADVVKAVQPRNFDTRGYFRDHRSDLNRISRLIDDGRLVATEREQYAYGPKLPEGLRYLSETGRVSIYDDGTAFIPRWTGIPDDAGGYWHQTRSPQGNDMYGMPCRRPQRLARDWWACGMRGVRFRRWEWVWW